MSVDTISIIKKFRETLNSPEKLLAALNNRESIKNSDGNGKRKFGTVDEMEAYLLSADADDFDVQKNIDDRVRSALEMQIGFTPEEVQSMSISERIRYDAVIFDIQSALIMPLYNEESPNIDDESFQITLSKDKTALCTQTNPIFKKCVLAARDFVSYAALDSFEDSEISEKDKSSDLKLFPTSLVSTSHSNTKLPLNEPPKEEGRIDKVWSFFRVLIFFNWINWIATLFKQFIKNADDNQDATTVYNGNSGEGKESTTTTIEAIGKCENDSAPGNTNPLDNQDDLVDNKPTVVTQEPHKESRGDSSALTKVRVVDLQVKMKQSVEQMKAPPPSDDELDVRNPRL